MYNGTNYPKNYSTVPENWQTVPNGFPNSSHTPHSQYSQNSPIVGGSSYPVRRPAASIAKEPVKDKLGTKRRPTPQDETKDKSDRSLTEWVTTPEGISDILTQVSKYSNAAQKALPIVEKYGGQITSFLPGALSFLGGLKSKDEEPSTREIAKKTAAKVAPLIKDEPVQPLPSTRTQSDFTHPDPHSRAKRNQRPKPRLFY
ncbi:MAG: hypothetical protein ACRC5C_08070 [Bacilli bacterium]